MSLSLLDKGTAFRRLYFCTSWVEEKSKIGRNSRNASISIPMKKSLQHVANRSRWGDVNLRAGVPNRMFSGVMQLKMNSSRYDALGNSGDCG